jgi:hypothetical protein
VIARARHIQDDRLFDCYLNARSGQPLDPPTAEHLADCGDCGARYADVIRFMDDLRTSADAQADEIFTPERLRIQQQQIARRTEQVGRAARVLSFPGRLVSRHMGSPSAHGITRWVYASAAAGLVIGVALGAMYDAQYGSGRYARQIVATSRPIAGGRVSRLTPVATAGTNPAHEAADDAFLSDLEVALERPHTRELQPFDTLTPHVRDVSATIR